MSTLFCLLTLSCWLLACTHCSTHTRVYRSHRKIIASFESKSIRLDGLVHSISATKLLIEILDEEIEEMLDTSSFWDNDEANVVVERRSKALEGLQSDQLEMRIIEMNIKVISKFSLNTIVEYYISLKRSLRGKLQRAVKRQNIERIILLERRLDDIIKHLNLASRLLKDYTK